jgi:hypothetical protein
MNDNYLWDRSGEADSEIKQLEETLGALRYQPKPLEIPAQLEIEERSNFRPFLAIAAAIAMVAVGTGLWFMLNNRRAEPSEATRNSAQPKQNQNQSPQQEDQPQQAVVGKNSNPPVIQKRNRGSNLSQVAVKTRNRRTMIRQPRLTPEEIAQKEQVLAALRLVSAKLNIAQRRTQGLPAPNLIRNQHKMG